MTLGNEQVVRQACQIAEDKDVEGWVVPRLSSPVPRKDCRLHDPTVGGRQVNPHHRDPVTATLTDHDHQPARADRDVPN
jgi:hypothetical protein